jgi:protein-disulfide isomerase
MSMAKTARPANGRPASSTAATKATGSKAARAKKPSGGRPAGKTAAAATVATARHRGLSTNARLTLALAAVLVFAVVAVLVVNRDDKPDAAAPGGSVAADVLVRPDSHKLATAADGKVTLVEFLDFECESCGAAYPSVKKMLADYQGRITFVVRNFPIASHPNAELAARTAQAAANQGRFADMSTKLFENQTQWGHKNEPQTEVFLGYARSLGLDMATFQRDLDDRATAARVAKADGEAAGVSGTPTFFLNGRKLELRSATDLITAVDTALNP